MGSGKAAVTAVPVRSELLNQAIMDPHRRFHP